MPHSPFEEAPPHTRQGGQVTEAPAGDEEETAVAGKSGTHLGRLPQHGRVSAKTCARREPPLSQVHPAILDLQFKKLSLDHKVVGGRVKAFAANWERITQDPTILKMAIGCPIPFDHTPRQGSGFSPRFSREQTLLISKEINDLLLKGAIVETQESQGQFVGHIFLREKKDGSQRPIFNLKQLNKCVTYQHFKMEGLFLLKTILQRNDYMAKIDLKDAYLCVPMQSSHRQFLRFRWENRMFQFQCLPFGLASAPRDFTKLLKPAISLLRRLGTRMIVYLDDILILNQSEMGIRQDVCNVIHVLTNLGFIVNEKKSVREPHRVLEFLGFLINSTEMTLSLPIGKLEKVREKCRSMIHATSVTVRSLAKLIGTLSSTMLAVLPAPLHYRNLQMMKSKGLLRNQSYETCVSLPPECKEELRWWIFHLRDWNSRTIISPHPDLTIETDASNTGWGAATQGLVAKGCWTLADKELHINAKELLAVLLAVKSFTRHRPCAHIHVRSDNMTTVAHINKLGGPRSQELFRIAKELWDFCLTRGILLSAEFLPGRENKVADTLSRDRPDSSDWRLDRAVFLQIQQKWGQCAWDLFASRQNAQLPKYISWKPDPGAAAIDAMQTRWGEELNYAFPPFCMVGLCLAKVARERGELVLIAPGWSAQGWYPTALNMIRDHPVLLPPSPDLLRSPMDEQHPLVKGGRLPLVAWRVTGKNEVQEEFRRTLPRFSPCPGEVAPGQFTLPLGKSGVAGVLGNRLIRFAHLWH